jgi:hypothetical protein
MVGLLSCLLAATFIIGAAADKLTPAEVIAKHLDSIGPADARAKIHSLKIKGTCSLVVRQGGSGQVDGAALLESQGTQNLITMTFDSADYPFEALKFNGKKFIASQFRPGFRTAVAQFFVANDVIFREGIAGGTLSQAWPLLNLQQNNPKLENASLKKIDGQPLQAITYNPRKGSDIKITLFFDPNTFQHVRTEYSRDITVTDMQRIGSGPSQAGQTTQRANDARVRASEEFSDFGPENGLNLPHVYKFHLNVQSETRPAVVDWVFNLTEFRFNEPLDAKDFEGS